VLKEFEGRVRLVVKDFPLPSHALARPAHEAARCAGVQGRHWEYRERLFAEQPRFERDALVRYASDLGLDARRFARCLDGREQAAAVEADVRQARELGVSATPTFIIGDEVLQGAHPVEAFRDAVTAALRRR